MSSSAFHSPDTVTAVSRPEDLQKPSNDSPDGETPDKQPADAAATDPKKRKKTVANRRGGGAAAAVAQTMTDVRMRVDKNVVDELLLVCGVIGSSTTTTATNQDGTTQEQIVPVTDCLNWLQDLQRALRRDDDLYRPISCMLGDWKIVQQKLLPLVLSCRYDNAMVLTICKILVILTKPLAENTVRAGKMVIDTASKKHSEEVIREQIKLRENALKQANTLMEYKRAFCHHPSHSRKLASKTSSDPGGVLSIFVSLLAEPLSRTGTARTETDHLTIELVLHLFRNLLSAEPLLHASPESAHRAQQLHNELVHLLEQELVLEILLVIGADLEQRENAQYNLLIMELLHHLIRNQDPTAVAKYGTNSDAAERLERDISSKRAAEGQDGSKRSSARHGSLKAQLLKEKSSFQSTIPSRHSHFGGTLVVKGGAGGTKTQFVSAARVGDKRRQTAPVAKRKNKKTEVFVGRSVRTKAEISSTDSGNGPMLSGSLVGGPAQKRAWQTLHNFCERFVLMENCYGPVMKSLKNEFRRDSVRLEDGDRVVFFRVVWFFCQWWRASGKRKNQEKSSSAQGSLGQLIFTMDVFTFNLVLNATDTFVQHKKYARLAQAVALLAEMMHLLHIMYTSDEETETIMSMGLMDRLFFGSDPLDRLPKLLSSWAPGTSSREYLCDLVEVTHMTLKLLDANAKACAGVASSKEAKHDTIAKMKAAVADFDVNSYFIRKIVSNQTVFMYTQLLSRYDSNPPYANHRVLAFFLRLSKVRVASSDESQGDEDGLPTNPLSAKAVTLEPMLYNIQLICVLDKILNDQTIRKEKSFSSLLSFAAALLQNFYRAAQNNPMLFVEVLFKHSLPHRFCDSVTNMYVNEDLRMMAVREILLEEQARFDEEEAKAVQEEEEDSDEELEFEDFAITGTSKPSVKSSKKRVIGDSDDEESDSDDENASLKSSIKKSGDKPESKIIQQTDKENYNDDDDDESSSTSLDGKASPKPEVADKTTGAIKSAENQIRKLQSAALENSSDSDSSEEDVSGPKDTSMKGNMDERLRELEKSAGMNSSDEDDSGSDSESGDDANGAENTSPGTLNTANLKRGREAEKTTALSLSAADREDNEQEILPETDRDTSSRGTLENVDKRPRLEMPKNLTQNN